MKKDITKKHIVHSFNELLNETPFENITIEDIIKKSELSRSTFYRHFSDKYDVIHYDYSLFIDYLIQSGKCKDWKDFYYYLLSNADKNRKLTLNKFSSKGINSYFKFAYKYDYQTIENVVIKKKGRELTEKEKCTLSIYSYGSIMLAIDWLYGKYDLTVEELAEQLYHSMPESMRDLW